MTDLMGREKNKFHKNDTLNILILSNTLSVYNNYKDKPGIELTHEDIKGKVYFFINLYKMISR